jgi:hypothetical protein
VMFCQKHWDLLRGEIEKRGLGHLITQQSGQIEMRLGQQMADPLLNAHNQFIAYALSYLGPQLLTSGDICPVCEMPKNCKCSDKVACVERVESMLSLAADEEAKRAGIGKVAQA